MKKLILIITLGALNAFAIDCLRSTFDIFAKEYPASSEPTTAIYKNFFVDSIYLHYADTSHSTEFDNNKYYYTGTHVDSAKTYTKEHGSNNWEIKVRSPEELTLEAYGVKTTITQEGDFKKVHQEGKGNPPIIEYLIYETKDSVYYIVSYLYASGNKDSYEHRVYIRNDTLYTTEEGLGAFIVRDSANESKCYEYDDYPQKEIRATYEYEMRGDTLTATEKILGGYRSTFTIFFVPSEKYSTAIISGKRRPRLNPAKSKDFDLLGRPAKNKHIFIIKR
ncbi:hypothetical protein [Fibrobacter sp. UWB7]|uniref:hypothetical protein n=1 Tax=Fibrobacter sp. UWB7 TaxID=1896206 RepID=UPI00091053CB|nr:hypothetical protein [Fibrobacter sp. UWB7]SHM82099.1 hypothetical protein SAMN05720467_2392 [Fibrobacter sp. UWB7]